MGNLLGKTIRKRKAKVKALLSLGSRVGVVGRTGTIWAVRIPFAVPAAKPGAFDVVGLGLNSVDLVTVVAEFPRTNSKQRLQQFARLPGGQTATAVAVCARLGWGASYLGRFGSDDLGGLSRESLDREGVHTGSAHTVAGARNQFAVVLVDARSGERTVLWDRDPALTMRPSDVVRDTIVAGRILLVDCHETAAATEAARYARSAGIPTVLDVEKVRPGIARLLQSTDAIIAAESFPAELTGYDAPGQALEAMEQEFNRPLVAVTLGSEGSLARCRGREIRTPAFRVECLDSTGAGDAFHGGFAAACLLGELDLEDALAYANAVAALNCRALGARGGMPRRDEVSRLLDARARQ
jgi:sulfofructose kinase